MKLDARRSANAKTVGETQRQGAAFLKDAGIGNPALDARVLLAGCLKLEMAELVGASTLVISPDDYSRYLMMIKQRQAHKPVHRILGYRGFYGRDFSFGEDCLEPRPETELLVGRILEDIEKTAAAYFGEIGVGSGVIACTLLAELPNAKALGTDIAEGAISAARNNAISLKVDSRLELVQTDCLAGVNKVFDFIVSNPPYITTKDLDALSKDVRLFDPAAALDGGVDGLFVYRKILKQAPALLQTGGQLYLETGHGQHRQLIQLANEMGWGIVSCHLDLSGLERIVVLRNERIS